MFDTLSSSSRSSLLDGVPAQTMAVMAQGSTEAAGPDLGMLGSGTSTERLRMQLRRIAPHFKVVLLSGETGTGKELAARALHQLRGEGVLMRCAALSHGVEGERESAKILDMLLRGGRSTLVIEHVGETPATSQARLLQGLDHWERALRGPESTQAAARVIACTNQDLRTLTRSGAFRQDLYYRLATVEIALAPLRERREEIDEMADNFLRHFAAAFGRRAERFSDEAREKLRQHSWPGNVRELKNVIRGAALECPGGTVLAEHLEIEDGSDAVEPAVQRSGRVRLQDVVDEHVQLVLRASGGNKVRAAELLGISRSTLYRMLEGSLAARQT